ncbi:hypothetical protein IE53DRAFT_367654 [Violaceomyces palustris]|uniref:Uncharacterized protein n=1 Tax=Violaceomyces palustris TaxID=1673888 RepID=A0ACD0P1F1_9BASI|nr:hypothetical protein IE53DRAFT_367654 [Violaceomyces palustris]
MLDGPHGGESPESLAVLMKYAYSRSDEKTLRALRQYARRDHILAQLRRSTSLQKLEKRPRGKWQPVESLDALAFTLELSLLSRKGDWTAVRRLLGQVEKRPALIGEGSIVANSSTFRKTHLGAFDWNALLRAGFLSDSGDQALNPGPDLPASAAKDGESSTGFIVVSSQSQPPCGATLVHRVLKAYKNQGCNSMKLLEVLATLTGHDLRSALKADTFKDEEDVRARSNPNPVGFDSNEHAGKVYDLVPDERSILLILYSLKSNIIFRLKWGFRLLIKAEKIWGVLKAKSQADGTYSLSQHKHALSLSTRPYRVLLKWALGGVEEHQKWKQVIRQLRQKGWIASKLAKLLS